MPKTKKQAKQQPQTEKKSPLLGGTALILVLAAIGVFAFTHPKKEETATQTAQTQSQPAEVPKSDFRVPAYYENPDTAAPLAPTLDPATVRPVAKEAYEVARRKPKLLAQLPCFCYCDRFGHKSLHSCYAGTHAEECDVCIKEALDADRLDSQGKTPQQIRDIIIKTYHKSEHS